MSEGLPKMGSVTKPGTQFSDRTDVAAIALDRA